MNFKNTLLKRILAAAMFCCLLPAGTFAAETFSFRQAVKNAKAQIGMEIDTIEASGKCLNPVTLTTKGTVYYCGYADWRSGFFPGSVWYLYELTRDKSLLPLARKYTEALDKAKKLTWHHDIGFIINCSYGNGLRLEKIQPYKEVMIEAAKSLCTRFRPKAGIIQSWDVKGNSWQSERGWKCPVIIDNMMNLELLFEATKLSGDSTYYKVAVSHADHTLKNQFRPNNSCYHVVDYDPETGAVRHKVTAQGYADESAWSRGQAWAIYGYTMCYRETGNRKYLDQALKTFEFMKNNKNMPSDLIPYWDMDAPKIPNEPRDVSSASVMASALYEISTYKIKNAASYRKYADKIMQSLASPAYTAALGTNGRFILMHSVGSIPHNSEIDVPLNYADYYYLEALVRKMKLNNKQPLF